MQAPDLYTIAANPFQGAYINAPAPPTAAFTAAYTTLPAAAILAPAQAAPHSATQQSAAATLIEVSNMMHYQRPASTREFTSASATTDYHMLSSSNNRATTFMNKTKANYSSTAEIRRTRSGHVSKSKAIKRVGEANLTKICPSCSKLWRLCNCSNIKNRPAPKPYCKFVPPRMLKKNL